MWRVSHVLQIKWDQLAFLFLIQGLCHLEIRKGCFGTRC